MYIEIVAGFVTTLLTSYTPGTGSTPESPEGSLAANQQTGKTADCARRYASRLVCYRARPRRSQVSTCVHPCSLHPIHVCTRNHWGGFGGGRGACWGRVLGWGEGEGGMVHCVHVPVSCKACSALQARAVLLASASAPPGGPPPAAPRPSCSMLAWYEPSSKEKRGC